MPTTKRHSGVQLDVARFDHELARRGLTARQLARIAKCHEVTLSRARQGRPINENTLRRITAALLQIPVLAGTELLLIGPDPNKKVA